MAWVEINQKEYTELFVKEDSNLSVFSGATVVGPGYIGQRYFAEDYFFTEWGFAGQDLPYIKSIKDRGQWKFWKWSGPIPKEDD